MSESVKAKIKEVFLKLAERLIQRLDSWSETTEDHVEVYKLKKQLAKARGEQESAGG